MTARAMLDDLTARGVHVRAEGDRLKLNAPVGVLTPDIKAALAARKAELLALLTAAPSPAQRPALRLVPKPERLHSVRSRSGQLTACVFDNCGGETRRTGVDIWQCVACGERFRVARLDAWEVELFDKWIN